MNRTLQRASSAATARAVPALGPMDAGFQTSDIYVVFTSIDETLAAVHAAADFAKALAVPVTLIDFREIPYPVAVDVPTGISPVETAWFGDRLDSFGLDVRVRVRLCRDALQAIPTMFAKRALVVVGGRRSWWPTRCERLCRTLEEEGHLVVSIFGVFEERTRMSKERLKCLTCST